MTELLRLGGVRDAVARLRNTLPENLSYRTHLARLSTDVDDLGRAWNRRYPEMNILPVLQVRARAIEFQQELATDDEPVVTSAQELVRALTEFEQIFWEYEETVKVNDPPGA